MNSKVRDVTTTDLPPPKKGEQDRFDEFALGVKQAYRPEWLESENALFINKLNFVAKNYEDTYKTVSGECNGYNYILSIYRLKISRLLCSKITKCTWMSLR